MDRMPLWICDVCGLEHPDTPEPPGCVLDRGEVTIEERGDLGPHPEHWSTHEELVAQPHETVHHEHGRGIHSLHREPRFGIGQWSFLVQTGNGNLLWDPPNYLDEEVLELVRGLGGVDAIATSHPHMFAAQVSWSHAFGRIPVYVNALDEEWVPRPDPVLEYWDDETEPLPGIRLIHLGGHMRGSAVALTADGTLLAGDTISAVPTHPAWVSFTRNYPKLVPLSPAVVRRIVDRLDAYDYDRLFVLNGYTVDSDAKRVVHRSAESHIRWASGEFDHLT
ncbi:hypothetical protein [Sciscionella marina]|uniref:hypothetical protein n=1 Tax=Sciscionella marina TaxID=508770 RepID=UPI0003712A38|nr:hypothetical protein [Sciscionella marina]